MRTRGLLGWALAAGTLIPGVAAAADVFAGPPADLSLTVYRAPAREGGSIDLDRLEGFALVSETRAVHLPAGVSRLRFEGVAAGIEPVSALVAGMPSVVIEKNLDGQLLSPSTLVAAALGKQVVMLRTRPKSGDTAQLPGVIESNADGVVFRSAEGVEALRCSGLSETFSFESISGLAATPTLSVQVRSPQAVTAVVTLSYLARGFDWAADYSATLSPDGRSMSLGAWVTLANGNATGFPAARTQVVAGKLNREAEEVDPVDMGAAIIARCWPRGSTSDFPLYLARAGASGAPARMMAKMAMTANAPRLEEVIVTAARRVVEEQLGDLKLYRVPERTTVASRQSKQVRLLDRAAIPVQNIYGADVDEDASETPWRAARLLLRTRNDRAHGLGIPLPSGRVTVFAADRAITILEKESDLRDTAVGEEVEIDLDSRADVQVRETTDSRSVDTDPARVLPLVPGVVSVRSARTEEVRHVEVSNALPRPIQIEVRLRLDEGAEVIRADHELGKRNGQPVFSLTVPANGEATLRFQTRRTVSAGPDGVATSGYFLRRALTTLGTWVMRDSTRDSCGSPVMAMFICM